MTAWLFFWVGAIATYRITILITKDIGPWGLFRKLRAIDRCSKLLKCPFCVSPYVGALIALTFYLTGEWKFSIPVWFLLVFAWSGITIALDRTFTADYQA